jgi:hypothetical protein
VWLYRHTERPMSILWKSRTFWLCAAAVSFVHACATTSSKPNLQKDGGLLLNVSVRHLEREDAWEVHYRLPEPVTAVGFQRGSYEFRQSNWAVASPAGVQLKRVEGGDFLWSASGGTFQEVTLRLKTYFRRPEKDYQVFIPYTDGGMLLYTGQLDLFPLECGTDTACDLEHATPAEHPFEIRYTFVPRPGEHLILLGDFSKGRTEWVSSGDGTYVYFGTATPIQSEHVTAIVDPGLPKWLSSRVEILIPKLFALYSERLGTKLNFKPIVFVSYGEIEPRRSVKGGTLKGLVQLDFRLPRRYQAEPDPDLSVEVAYFIAHEAAHLWNGQMFRRAPRAGSWLHEGGADALAWRALLAQGIIDLGRFWREQSRNVSSCLLGLEGQPLKDSSRPGRFNNHYSCGATINLLAEAALRSSGSREDLFDFWRGVFRVNPDGTYDDHSFLEALRAIPGSDQTVALVRRLIEGPTQDIEPALRSEFDRLGLQTLQFQRPQVQ